MFRDALNFNQNLTDWNTGEVTTMSQMFDNATSFNGNISNWDTSKVKSMYFMFNDATSFNQDVSNWDTGNVSNMGYMFDSASSFDQNLSSWNTSNVTNMYAMFRNVFEFDYNLGSWDVSKVTNANNMFLGVKLSAVNYNSLLEGWSFQSLQNETVFNAGNSKYSLAGLAGRTVLIDDYNWSITDGGFVADPNITFVEPTTSEGESFQTFIVSNVSVENSSSIENLTIFIYNQTRLVYQNSSIISPFFWNITNLSLGNYYLNASVVDNEGLVNYTNTIQINLTESTDTDAPNITWVSPTPNDGETINESFVYLNTTINDDSETSAWFDWDNSLVGYWSFDYSNSTGVFDNSSYGSFGEFKGGVGTENITSGKRGTALDFDGVNDYVQTIDDGTFDFGTNNFTVSAWVYLPEQGSAYTRVFVSKWNTGANRGTNEWLLHAIGTGGTSRHPSFEIEVEDDSIYATHYQDLSLQEWHLITGMRDGEYIRIYVNGELKNSTYIGNVSVNNAGRDLVFGRIEAGYNLNGSIDEVIMFNRTLSDVEVLALYNGSRLYNNFTNLEDGTYDYKAYAIDEAGNLNISENRNVTVDTKVYCTTVGNNGVLDSAGTTYTLTENITSTGTCLTVSAANVTIDCNGYWINYSTGGAADTYGIDSDRFNTTIKNCNIIDGNFTSTETTRKGIMAHYSEYITIFNNSIKTNSSISLHLLSFDYANISNNNVHSILKQGIYISGGGENEFYNNVINSSNSDSSLTCGITSNGGDRNLFVNNNIYSHGCGVGIVGGADNNTLTSNEIISEGNTIYISNTKNNLIRDCIESEGNIYSNFGITENLTLINCSYGISLINNEGSYVLKKWYYQAQANYSNGTAVNEANVIAYNNSGGIEFNVLTGVEGHIPRQEVIEYNATSSGKTYFNNYTINASLTGYVTDSNEINFTITENKLDDFFNLSEDISGQCSSIGNNGVLDSAGTTYTLTENITSTGTCLSVSAANVTLDCAGYTIEYSTSGENDTYGFYTNQFNTTIKNCNIVDGNRSGNSSRIGIYVDEDNALIFNNTVNTSNSNSIYVGSAVSNLNVSQNNLYSYSDDSVRIFSTSSGNNFERNTIISSWDNGVQGGTNNDFVLNDITGDNGIRFSAGGSNTVFNNNITSTGLQDNDFGAYVSSPNNNFTGNKIISDQGKGVAILYSGGNGNTFEDNIISSNNSFAFQFYQNTYSNSLINNTFISNSTVVYIQANSTNSTLRNNTFISDGGDTTLLYIDSNCGNNLFYHNNFTETIGYFIDNNNDTNQFNTTVGGVPQGNYYFNITSLAIYDSDSDGWGDTGSDYPVNDTTWSSFFDGPGADWGPYTTNEYLDIDAPNITWVSPTPNDGETINESFVYLNTTINDDSETSAWFDWDNSLVGYWSFDYSNSTGVFDNSSYGSFGEFKGGVGTENITSGKRGTALDFDGVNDYVEVEYNSNLPNETQPRTISFWMNPKNVTPNNLFNILGYGRNSNGQLFMISISGSSKLYLWTHTQNYESSFNATEDTWQHVALTYNGTHAFFYKNGVSDSGGTSSINTNTTFQGSKFYMGYNTYSGDYEYFNGSLDEVTVFNRALSNQEILSLYNGSRLYNNFTSLDDGTYDYKAYAIDVAGNLNITENRNVTVDTTTYCSSVGNNGVLDSAGTTYTLTENITSTGTCLTVTAANVTIDCNGYWINYSTGGAASTYGFYTNQFNTTVKNCNVVDGNRSGNSSRIGIYYHGADNGTVFKNNVNTSNSGGVLLNSADYNNLTFNTISKLEVSGNAVIIDDSSYGVIYGNNIESTGDGLVFQDTCLESNVESNNINSTARTLFCNGACTNFTFVNNTITSTSSRVLYIYGSQNNSFIDNVVVGSSDGTNFYNSQKNLVIRHNSTGVTFWGGDNNVFRDCIYVGVVENNDVFGDATNNTFINCSYSIENIEGDTSSLIRKWYYQAQANYSNGTAINGANITAYNNSDGVEFSVLTGADAYTSLQEVTEYVNVNGTRTYFNNYTINASLTGYVTDSNEINFTITENKLDDFFTLEEDTSGQCISIGNNGVLDSAGTTYTLTENITSTGTCLNVTAENVTIDCDGYSITYSTGGQNDTYGLLSSGYNTTAKNCVINDGNWSGNSSRHGIYFYSNSDNSLIYNNTINVSNGIGIYSRYLDDCNITGNTIYTNVAAGIYSHNSANIFILDNNVTNNVNSGYDGHAIHVYTSANAIIRRNTAVSGGRTILLQGDLSHTNYTVIDNTASSPAWHSIYMTNIHNSNIYNNNVTGYWAGFYIRLSSSNNTFINNTVRSTHPTGGAALDMWNSYNSTFIGNNFSDSFKGINIYSSPSSGHRFINNTVVTNVTNARGIEISSISDITFIGQILMATGTGSIGVYIDDNVSNILFKDTTLFGEDEDVYINTTITSVNFTFINSTYNSEYVGAGNELIRKWYYQAQANYSNGTVANEVNVTAYNNSDGIEFSTLTGADGYTTRQEVTEYKNIGGTRTYFNNYTINASLTGYVTDSNEINFTITENKLDDFFTLEEDTSGQCISIGNNGVLDSAGTTYTLTENITSTGTCLSVSAANVTIDCNGYTINYSVSGGSAQLGVYSNNQQNTTVKNCVIIDGNFSSTNTNRYPIYFDRADNGLIYNNTLTTYRSYGLYIEDSANGHVVSNNNITSNINRAIRMDNSDHNRFEDNTVTSGQIGFQVSDCSNTTFDNNTVSSSSWAFTISSLTNSFLTNNYVNTTSSDAMRMSSSLNNVITNNTAIAGLSGYTGIELFSSSHNNILTNNTGIGAFGIGIVSSNNNTLINNTAIGTNNAMSIWYGSYNNILIGNNATNTGTGGGTHVGLRIEDTENVTVIEQTATADESGSYNYGVFINNASNVLIKDSTISGEDEDVYINTTITSVNFTFINSTYNSEYVGAGNELIRKWYYQAQANYSNGTVANEVNVTAYNNSDGIEFSTLTGVDGYTTRQEVTEYKNVGGTRTYFNNYTINATLTGYVTDSNIFNFSVTENKLDDFFNLSEDISGQCISVGNSGVLDSAGTTYTLTENITSTGTCLSVTVDNVTLDCDGYWINYSTGGAASTYGIYTHGEDNLTIKNCKVVDGNYSSSEDNRYGLYLITLENSLIYNTFVKTNSSQAIRLTLNSYYNNFTLVNSTSEGSTGIGIESNSGNMTFTDIFVDDFYVSGDYNNLTNIVADNPDSTPIRISGDYNRLIEFNSTTLTEYGVDVSGNYNFIGFGNLISNSSYGAVLGGSYNEYSNIEAVSNFSRGIYTSGGNNTYTDLVGTGGGAGIYVQGNNQKVYGAIGESINQEGIYIGGNHTLYNISGTSTTDYGVYMVGADDSYINNMTGISTNVEGIRVALTFNTTLVNLYGQSSSGIGLELASNSGNNNLSNSTIVSTSNVALFVGSNNNYISNNTLLGNNTILVRFSNAKYNTFYGNKIETQDEEGILLDIYSDSGDNLFYHNNFTETTGYFIDNDNETNQFNTTVEGVPQGNYYFNITSLAIYDSDSDGWGDTGSDYPLNSTTWPTRFNGVGADWGPATTKNLPGWLNVTLVSPKGLDNNIPQNETFNAIFNVTCEGEVGSSCGIVNGRMRYNSSSISPDTNVPGGDSYDTPFYTLEEEIQSCGNLNQGDNPCSLTWQVNSTGDVRSRYLLDAYFNSSISSLNNSEDFEIKVISPLMSLTLSEELFNVDFGSDLTPGSVKIPAKNNSNSAYNITCINPNAYCNVSIKGNHNFTSGPNQFDII
jgi:parallel beta-helix repeat protein/surface protein